MLDTNQDTRAAGRTVNSLHRLWPAVACAALLAGSAHPAEGPARASEPGKGRAAWVAEGATHGRGRMRFVEGIPFLTLAGTWSEMGEQYGAFMKQRLGPAGPSTPLPPGERRRLERFLGPRTGPFLRGVASGFGAPLDDVLRAVFGGPPQGCSSILARARPDAGEPRLLHAKNLDLPGSIERAHAVVEFRPAGELRFVATTVAGVSDGMNERGITLSIDAGPGCRAAAQAGPAAPQGPGLLERMLELLATARSLADGDRVVRAGPIDAAMLLVVGSAAEGDGAVYDLACGAVRRTAMGSRDQLFATNTYLHPDLTPPASLRECPRYRLLDDRLRGRRIATPEDVEAALADAGVGAGVNNPITRQSVVYDAGAKVLRLAVARGYAAWGTWIEYDWAQDRATVLREALFDLGPVAPRTRAAEKVASLREPLPGASDQVRLWAELDRRLALAGATRAGAGTTVYHGDAAGRVDVEVLQPVSELPADAGDRVSFRVTDPIEVASVTHRGPHSTLAAAHVALAAWMQEHGCTAVGPTRERWLRGAWNEPDPRRWETQVEIPVAPGGCR